MRKISINLNHLREDERLVGAQRYMFKPDAKHGWDKGFVGWIIKGNKPATVWNDGNIQPCRTATEEEYILSDIPTRKDMMKVDRFPYEKNIS